MVSVVAPDRSDAVSQRDVITTADVARLQVDITKQRLWVLNHTDEVVQTYPISTGKNGAGEQNGSECTPRGAHIVRAKIGAGQAPNTVFVARRATGEIYHPGLRQKFPDRDWILTRILWLSGSEPGRNRLGEVDTMRRYIYFHGSPDDVPMGWPGSRGCIRMRNADIIELFDLVKVGTPVEIVGEFVGEFVGDGDESFLC